jgi:hypothetical protein
MLAKGNSPWPLGSGKLDRPWLRMQAANTASPFARSARSAGLSAGGPPLGISLRQSRQAARNRGEFGSAFPVITNPRPCGPGEAATPCDVMH